MQPGSTLPQAQAAAGGAAFIGSTFRDASMKPFGIYCTLFLLLALPSTAHAYLDPGTGSMLLSVLIGLLSTAYFMLRKLPALFRPVLFRLTGKTRLLERRQIVIYGESANYWGTFRPLLEELGRRGVAVQYLTSSENDPCFTACLPDCIRCQYIGTGNTAYTTLNLLEADAMVLTTPGVGVLQIRRSKGVGKYIHILHSIGDIHYYKLFSFDYYDAIICCGEYQVASLRALEALRGTKPKELPLAGCPYLDALVAKRDSLPAVSPDDNCVLVAPTWGRLGMLTRYGAAIPKALAEAGFHVILRPHPQSYISDTKLMEHLEIELAANANITWDRNPDGFASLRRASVLISDFSGVIYDFAFVFFRPVITIYSSPPAPDSFEAFDIPFPYWDGDIVKQLGAVVSAEDIPRLPALVREIARETNWPERIRRVRDANIVNFGCAAGPVTDAILSLVAKESV